MGEERIVWIDYAKALGIFLVVLGHIALPGTVINVIYAFHMPLFFFISGYLFQADKNVRIKKFIVKRWHQLVVPYFLLNIIIYVLWLIKLMAVTGAIDVYKMVTLPLFSIIYGTAAIDGFLPHCVPMWFIACLFTVELLFFIPLKNKALLSFLCLLLAFVDYKVGFYILPWGLNIALTAISFYWLGNSFRKLEVQAWWNKTSKQKRLAILCFLILSFGISVYYNGRVDMGSRQYGNYLLFLNGSVTGLLIFIAIAWQLSIMLKRNYSIEYLSNNTILVLAFHRLLILVCSYILHNLFSVFPFTVDEGNIGYGILLAYLAIMGMVPVIYFMNRFLPVAAGKKNKTQYRKENIKSGPFTFNYLKWKK